MKKLFFILFLIPAFLHSQTDATIFEVVRLKVKQGSEKAFEAAVKAHNDSFHGIGLYQARLFYNINGPYGGEYSWVMGPTNFTAMDSRPGEGAHDDDWEKVMAHVESVSSPQYWSRSEEVSHIVSNDAFTKSTIWLYDLAPGQGARFSELMAKVKEVYAEKTPDRSYSVVFNRFSNTEGKDAAIVFQFENWARLDEQSEFSKQFEEVHGAGTWHTFLNQFNEIVDGRDDWMRVLVE